MSHPTDNLVRIAPQRMEFRSADDGGGNTLFGHFTVFDEWTEIHSWWEGDFLERNAPGMLDDTLKARAGQVKCLYDHGYDPQIGNKPLGAVRELRGDAYYEVDLFDASYVDDLRPGLRAGVFGASYRFRVTGESWHEPTKPTAHNPAKLPERTIESVELYEFGPVTFPAYESASAGLRSGTDTFFDRVLSDPAYVARLTERLGPRIVGQIIDDGRASDAPGRRSSLAADGPGVTRGLHPSVLRIRAAALATAR